MDTEFRENSNQPKLPPAVATPAKESILTPLVVLVLILSALIAVIIFNGPATSKLADRSTTAQQTNILNAFDGIALEAMAVYVFDVNTGKVLYSQNAETQLPLASLTKLMTALIASEEVPSYTVVPIGSDDLLKEGDSGLKLSEKWRLSDLLKYTLIKSSNDGASAIAGAIGAVLKDSGNNAEDGGSGAELELSRAQKQKDVFISTMNAKAVSLGLRQTYFLNETGLDYTKDVSGGYGSARDVALLFGYLLSKHFDIIESTASLAATFHSLDNLKHEAINTNPDVARLSGLVGSKTGFTDLAGGNLVIAFDAGIQEPIIIAVLGSSENGRFNDAEKLYWATLESLRQDSNQ